MNVSLTPQLEELVRQKVESGLYASSSEVVREALRLMEAQDRKLEELRREVKKSFDQLDQGLGQPLDIQDTVRRARERWLAQQGK